MLSDLMADSSHELRTWRIRVLNRALLVAAVAALPVIALDIREAIYNPWQWPAALTFTALYLFVAALAVFRRLGFHLRAWGLLLAAYAAGALAFA